MLESFTGFALNFDQYTMDNWKAVALSTPISMRREVVFNFLLHQYATFLAPNELGQCARASPVAYHVVGGDNVHPHIGLPQAASSSGGDDFRILEVSIVGDPPMLRTITERNGVVSTTCEFVDIHS